MVKGTDKPFPLITTALQAELDGSRIDPLCSLSTRTPALGKAEFPVKHFKTLHIILVRYKEVQFFPLDFLFCLSFSSSTSSSSSSFASILPVARLGSLASEKSLLPSPPSV